MQRHHRHRDHAHRQRADRRQRDGVGDDHRHQHGAEAETDGVRIGERMRDQRPQRPRIPAREHDAAARHEHRRPRRGDDHDRERRDDQHPDRDPTGDRADADLRNPQRAAPEERSDGGQRYGAIGRSGTRPSDGRGGERGRGVSVAMRRAHGVKIVPLRRLAPTQSPVAISLRVPLGAVTSAGAPRWSPSSLRP